MIPSGLLIEYRPVIPTLQGRVTASIPAFNLAGFAWLGASYIAVEFPISFPEVLALSAISGIPDEEDQTFVLAIRWPTTPDGLNPNRRLIWTNDNMVLNYPSYDGEILPTTGAVFEVWTINYGGTGVSLAAPITMNTTKLIPRFDPFFIPVSSTSAVENDNIWSPLPCPNPTSFIYPRV